MATVPPIYSIGCIDYRFPKFTDNFYTSINQGFNYFSSTTAGSALALGYDAYRCTASNKNDKVIDIMKQNLLTNLQIALTLQPITHINLLMHQHCGAMQAFLKKCGYPYKIGSNNYREIKMNQKILVKAKKQLRCFNIDTINLDLIDINGSVAQYNKCNKWTILYKGNGTDINGLWYGYNVGCEFINKKH